MNALCLSACFVLLSAALVLALIRLLRGPSFADRIVALELMSSLILGLIAAFSVYSGAAALLDVAIVLALTGFLAAVAFSLYVERLGNRDA